MQNNINTKRKKKKVGGKSSNVVNPKNQALLDALYSLKN